MSSNDITRRSVLRKAGIGATGVAGLAASASGAASAQSKNVPTGGGGGSLPFEPGDRVVPAEGDIFPTEEPCGRYADQGPWGQCATVTDWTFCDGEIQIRIDGDDNILFSGARGWVSVDEAEASDHC